VSSKCKLCGHKGPHNINKEHVDCGDCGERWGALEAGMHLQQLRKEKQKEERAKSNRSVTRSYRLK